MHDQRTPQKGLSPDHLALGLAIREVRARRAFSQEELGNRAGLHRNYIGAIERGEINPTFRILLKVSRGLSVALSTLVALYERNTAGGRR